MDKIKLPYLFIIIAILFFGLFFFIETNNNSFLLNDFKVYYSASQVMLDGGQPYGVAFGLSSGFFKYSPVTLFLFTPYTLFSFETAKLIHFMAIAIFSIGSFLLCFSLCNRYFETKLSKRIGFLSLLLLISVVHLTRELHLGNINMIMVFLFLLAIYLMQNNKITWSALIFAVLVLLKPYFLILILPLIVARNWKLIAFIWVIIPVLILLPALFLGFDKNTELLKGWIDIMGAHNSAAISEHTFSSIFYSYTGIILESHWQLFFIGIVGAIYGLARLKELAGTKSYDQKKQLVDFFILLALIPNLVITDSQHFLFSIPLISLILGHLRQEFKWYLITTFIILLFFYGANANDLLGNQLSNKLDTFSTIGVSNLLLIFFLIYLIRKKEKEISISS